ncbi:MAG TPA: START domain-containing protein [Puia sp.]|nr:START domain-containing protein [Puia sp.]
MKAFLLFFLVLSFANVRDMQGTWQFVKEQDGIRMYNRPSQQSKFNDIKIEVDLHGTLNQVAAILADAEKYTEWAYGTKTSIIVKKINHYDFVYYSVIDVPWPASDRDFYAHCKIIHDSSSHSLKVVSESIRNYMPEKKNIVRIPLSRGTWDIKAMAGNKIHLVYILELDPGGNVPAWLMNIFSTKGPLETFENLKQKLKRLNRE